MRTWRFVLSWKKTTATSWRRSIFAFFSRKVNLRAASLSARYSSAAASAFARSISTRFAFRAAARRYVTARDLHVVLVATAEELLPALEAARLGLDGIEIVPYDSY